MGCLAKTIFYFFFFMILLGIINALMEAEHNDKEFEEAPVQEEQAKPKAESTKGIDPFLTILRGKKVIRQNLKDPDSARFREVCMTEDGVVFGKVNAKNSFGAYTGYKDFIVLGSLVEIDSPFRKEHNSFVKVWNVFVAKKKIKKCLR